MKKNYFKYSLAIAIILALLQTSIPAQDMQSMESGQIDLNCGDCENLAKLSITQEQREAICEKMLYGGGFKSIYDLWDMSIFTPEEFARLKPLVKISRLHVETTPLDRVDNLYFKIGDWFSGDGASASLIDEWIISIMQQPVLSKLDYRDLVSIQNVSPMDAVALLRFKQNGGTIKDRRQLRGINGLSARGYVSVRDFMGYGEENGIWRLGGYFGSRWSADAGEKNPYSHIRGKVSYGPFSMGFRFGRSESEPIDNGNWMNPLAYPDTKFYLALTRYKLGDFKIRRAVAGDFAASFGEGVCFGSGDYYSSRRSGTGFDIRQLGIYPDISSSRVYTLRGVGLETKYSIIEPTVFISVRDKTAILNPDSVGGGFTEFAPNLPNWNDKVKETLIGGNLTVSPTVNLRLGVTGYHAKYSEFWNPLLFTIIDEEYLPWGGNNKTDERDRELFERNSMRDELFVFGFHGLYNIGSLTLSSEYARMPAYNQNIYEAYCDSISENDGHDSPYGLVSKAQLVTNRFSLLALYRHYDVDFDNPYNRGFSEYYRYKGSLLEKDYRLVNPEFIALAEENPCPQAEDGIYFQFNGRPFRQLMGTLEFDAWTRLTDMSDYRRIVLKANYRPNSRLTFRLWRKWQGRSASNALLPTSFTVDEIRLTAETRLSDYSDLGFTVVHSFVGNPPKPDYVGSSDPLGADPLVGNVLDASDGLMLTANINVTEKLKFSSQAIVYRGWLWNFENNDFAILESSTDALRWWLAVSDRLAENLSVTLKLTIDKPLTNSNHDIRDSYSPENEIEGGTVRETSSSWLIQMDYFF